MEGKVKLYSYWRSSCSWRVRIAFELKGVEYEYVPVNLLKGEQKSSDYVDLNPSGMVPCLIIGDLKISQSIAILEYLEETLPDGHKLYPSDTNERAICRQMVMIIACDTQPLQNLHVVKAFGEKGSDWAKQVIINGLTAFDRLVRMYGGAYCFGDTISVADICLVPQLYNARRFGIEDIETRWPKLFEVEKRLSTHPAFICAHPDQQPDRA